MEQFIKDLVAKYGGKTPYEKLALTEEQKQAVAELEAAMKKCRDAHVGFVEIDYATYAYNNEDVYDFDCNYNDYSCCDINLTKLHRVRWVSQKMLNGNTDCTVSFYSTTFPEGGEGILY